MYSWEILRVTCRRSTIWSRWTPSGGLAPTQTLPQRGSETDGSPTPEGKDCKDLAEVLAQRHVVRRAGGGQVAEPEGIFDSSEQAIVILRDSGAITGNRSGGDDQRHHMPARAAATATGITGSLVESDQQQAAVAVGRRAQNGGHHAAQPVVAGRDAAIVHVVAHVGRDPGKARDLATAHIGRELRERHDVGRTARGVVADVVVIQEGVV